MQGVAHREPGHGADDAAVERVVDVGRHRVVVGRLLRRRRDVHLALGAVGPDDADVLDRRLAVALRVGERHHALLAPSALGEDLGLAPRHRVVGAVGAVLHALALVDDDGVGVGELLQGHVVRPHGQRHEGGEDDQQDGICFFRCHNESHHHRNRGRGEVEAAVAEDAGAGEGEEREEHQRRRDRTDAVKDARDEAAEAEALERREREVGEHRPGQQQRGGRGQRARDAGQPVAEEGRGVDADRTGRHLGERDEVGVLALGNPEERRGGANEVLHVHRHQHEAAAEAERPVLEEEEERHQRRPEAALAAFRGPRRRERRHEPRRHRHQHHLPDRHAEEERGQRKDHVDV